RQALSTFAASGVPTVWIIATRSAAGIPFGAMAHLLPLGTLPGGEPVSTMHALTERVAELGLGSRVVIGGDDAHLLDDASAATLAALALRVAAYLVITARAGRAVPDALTTLVKDGLMRRVDLGALPEQAVDTLIDLSLEGPVAGLARRRLHAECAGNPLA